MLKGSSVGFTYPHHSFTSIYHTDQTLTVYLEGILVKVLQRNSTDKMYGCVHMYIHANSIHLYRCIRVMEGWTDRT